MTRSRFRIVIAGLLDPGFGDGFVGVTQIDEGANTVLEGAFIGQSHLHGLLDQLRNLGLDVTSFTKDATAPQQ